MVWVKIMITVINDNEYIDEDYGHDTKDGKENESEGDGGDQKEDSAGNDDNDDDVDDDDHEDDKGNKDWWN